MIPYTPKCNVIENWFNQIKHYLKLNKKVLKYDELVIEISMTLTFPPPKTNYPPMIGAHIARLTQPPTQYLGKGRGYSTYYPMNF